MAVTDIEQIMTSTESRPNDGLLTYIKAECGGDWDKFQLRPWHFNMVGQAGPMGTGYLLLDDESEVNMETNMVTQDVMLGYCMAIDQAKAYVQAAKLRDKLNRVIHEWSRCHLHWVKEIKLFSGGMTPPMPSHQIASEIAGAWAIVVFRVFQITYRAYE